MTGSKGTPLADWIESVRTELTDAQDRFRRTTSAHPKNAVLGLVLEEMVFEAELITENTDGGKLSAKIFVLSGEIDSSEKKVATQKLTLRFRPISSDGGSVMMGDDDDPDAFG